MSKQLSEGFNFAEVDAKKMRVTRRGEQVVLDGKIVVADNKEAYGGDAKTIAAMAAETVARVTQDSAQADRAYIQALEQAEEDPEARWARDRVKAWQTANRIADAQLKYDEQRECWYFRYLVEDRKTGVVQYRYREISDAQMNYLGQYLRETEQLG